MKSTLLVILAVASVLQATTTVQVPPLGISNTQAILLVTTDQGALTCTVVASTSSTLSPLVNDVNTSMFSGANAATRQGAKVSSDGKHLTFPLGRRKTDLALVAPWWISRALPAASPIYGTVTCGSDSAVSFQFTTAAIPYGSTYASAVQFDSRALGNYAVPYFDFTDLTKSYVDPQTGYQYKLLTGPGQAPLEENAVTGTLANNTYAGNIQGEILSSTNWTNPTNCLTPSGSVCTYSTVGQDWLKIRLASTCGSDGNCGGDWEWLGNTVGKMLSSVDSYQVSIPCNGNGSSIVIDVVLSWNSSTQGSEAETVTCPSSTAPQTYPSSLTGGGTASWQSTNYQLVPAMYFHVMQRTFSVTTSGTAVTWVSGGSYGALFSLDPRVCAAGSLITIAGSEYTIASCNSATSLTLTTSAGSQTGVTAYMSGFSIWIRKHTASAGTLNVEGPTVTLASSDTFTNGNSGFQQYCASLTSTDSSGHVGRFCTIVDAAIGTAGIYWVTDDLQSRFIGRFLVLNSATAQPALPTADEYNVALVDDTQSIFDSSDPNSFYATTSLVSNGRSTLIKMTYNPSGVGGCSQTANYQALPLDSNYNANNMLNCNITQTEVTRPSLGTDIWSQLPSTVTNGKFGTGGPTLSFIQNGLAVMLLGSQDLEAWFVTVTLSTGVVDGVFSTYMNSTSTTSIAPCRACVLHGTEPGGTNGSYYGFITNSYEGGSSTGSGPYEITVSTSLTSTPSMSVSACQTAVGTMSLAYWLIQYSNGCDSVTLTGSDNIPCDPTPSTWESANAPVCSWMSGWTQWQAGAVIPGDWFQDPNTGYEDMVFAKNTSGTTWIIIRNIFPPQGPLMQPPAGVNPGYLRSHSTNWTAALLCNMPGTQPVSTTETTGAGIIWDRFWAGHVGHGALQPQGSVVASYFDDIGIDGIAARFGTLPGAASTAGSSRVLNGAPFAGQTGIGGFNNAQSHPGWQGNTFSFTDFAPLAPTGGGSFQLWAQSGVTTVAGSLYKIPVASANITPIPRYLPEMVWSGMWNFQDVSGSGTIGSTSASYYEYCIVPYSGGTCGQSGESVGDLFMNVPQVTLDGNSGGIYDYNRANASPIGFEPMAALEYCFTGNAPANTVNLGQCERRITTGSGRYNGQDTYSNSKLIPGSDPNAPYMFNCGTPNMQRFQDVCFGPQPVEAALGASNTTTFRTITIPLPSGSTYAEIEFGYEEFDGGPNDVQCPTLGLCCTSRREICNTSAPTNTPFNWTAETRTLTSCGSGCSVVVNALWGRAVYYRIGRSKDGTTWTYGPINLWPQLN